MPSLQHAFSHHGDFRAAILFGSVAQGHATVESDIDLAIMTAAPRSAKEKMALTEDIAALTGRPVELVDLRVVGEPLLGQIVKHGVRLLGGDMDYGELSKRHVFAEADFMPCRRRILAQRRKAWIGK